MNKPIAVISGVAAEIIVWWALSPLLIPLFDKFPSVSYWGFILVVGLPFLVTYSTVMAHLERETVQVSSTPAE